MLKLVNDIFSRWSNPFTSRQKLCETDDSIIWRLSDSTAEMWFDVFINKMPDNSICINAHEFFDINTPKTILRIYSDFEITSGYGGTFSPREIKDLVEFFKKELELHKPYKLALDTVESWAKKYFADVTVTSDLRDNSGCVSMWIPDGIHFGTYLKFKVKHINGFYGPMVSSDSSPLKVWFSISPKRPKYVKTVQCEYGPDMDQIIDLEKMLIEAFSKLYAGEKPDSNAVDWLNALRQSSILGNMQEVPVVTPHESTTPVKFKVLKRRNRYVEPKEVYEYMNGNIGTIKHVLFNETKKVTTVIFTDGTKITSKCIPAEEFDPEVGYAMCIMKRIYGNRTNFKKVIKDYMIASTHRNEVIQRKALRKAEKAVTSEQKKVTRKKNIKSSD